MRNHHCSNFEMLWYGVIALLQHKPTFNKEKIFKNTDGKGKNPGSQHFSFSPNIFLCIRDRNHQFNSK